MERRLLEHTGLFDDDLLGDGLPALAGSSAGVVLAWTSDLDSDATSRDDQRIAVALFDPVTRNFGSSDHLAMYQPSPPPNAAQYD